MRTEDDGAVRSLVLCRPEEYNTITAELRDELAAAVDAAEADDSVRVVLLRAEGAPRLGTERTGGQLAHQCWATQAGTPRWTQRGVRECDAGHTVSVTSVNHCVS